MAPSDAAPEGGSPPRRGMEDAHITLGAVACLRGADGGLTHLVLPADRMAASAVRTVLGFCFGRSLDARAMSDAKLLATELVANAVVHAPHAEDDRIAVRIRLDPEVLHLEVHNVGIAGTIASGGGDHGRRRGVGLNLVGRLSTRWGVRRGEDTCVWAEMARA